MTMKDRCAACHWWRGKGDRASDPFKVMSNGKIYPCVNIGVDGWDYWCDNQKEPEDCEAFCKVGEYVPTGIWADIAKLAEAIVEKIELEEQHESSL